MTDTTFHLSDQPAMTDELEIDRYVKGLTDFLTACETPLTLSIKGEWGAGKTSIMRQVEARIKANNDKSDSKKALNIWFDVWQFSLFSYDEQLPIIFLSRLVSQIYEGYKGNQRKLSFKERKMKKRIHNLLSIARDVGNGFAINKFGIDLSKFTSGKEDVFNQIEIIKNEFKELINEVTKDEIKRIIIYVDDLDRIEPKRAVELLETIKVILDVEKCVFVLAIDHDVVIRGISDKYNFDMNNHKELEKANSFFDKIIQVPFGAPIEDYKFGQFIDNYLSDKNLNKEQYKKEDLEKLLIESVGKNPRSIKRVLNIFNLNRHIKNFDPGENLLLFSFICMEQSYKDIYSQFIVIFNSIKDNEEKDNKENPEMVSHILKRIKDEYITETGDTDVEKLPGRSWNDAFFNKVIEIANRNHLKNETLSEIINISLGTSKDKTKKTGSQWNEYGSFEELFEAHCRKNNMPSIEDTQIIREHAEEVFEKIKQVFKDLNRDFIAEYKSSPEGSRSSISFKREGKTLIVDLHLQKNGISIELPIGKRLSDHKDIEAFLEDYKFELPKGNRINFNKETYDTLENKNKDFTKILAYIINEK
ncbi:KAP family P-loop domain-containing protein [Halolactibacillus halophilus]|uniref:KAP family P-loop domain-containing protein n=1 Tax=Halolactibacillus halophilus TaxID=306540 RepID=A0A1I5QE45_9BACI|nr:P-loop NTPase fold protein [Halolactibacillus halophilus]GEM02092.1 hypothetical protein HHA03_16240 [Halolactibacillus halophilus]SFP44564.1 KAP family P-loop domain-containing protein [Halolactibacillus halophilus]